VHVMVTGAAGFIGAAVCEALLRHDVRVLGIDNVNDYYDRRLKLARLARLQEKAGFEFVRADISNRDQIFSLSETAADLTHIVHLAAQAGVRHSLINPYEYVASNVMGHVVMSEFARGLKDLRHFVYASSSSVYGSNQKQPFSVDDKVDQPDSLYAATKRADELIARTYAHLWGLPCTGLRFFTVYGPWGRPDMATFIFTDAIFRGRKIALFNHGEMWRDFTYIDDIVEGVLGVLDRPPNRSPPSALYNLGNQKPVKLTDFVAQLETAIGRKAEIEYAAMQPGDVPSTYADIEASQRDFGFEPRTPISEGLPRFVAWFRSYHGLA
jgi:UDP-glucuronate 4-epimerase